MSLAVTALITSRRSGETDSSSVGSTSWNCKAQTLGGSAECFGYVDFDALLIGHMEVVALQL